MMPLESDRLLSWDWRDVAGQAVPHLLGAELPIRLQDGSLAFYDVESSRSLAINFRHLVI
jgi:hypothetical protein